MRGIVIAVLLVGGAADADSTEPAVPVEPFMSLGIGDAVRQTDANHREDGFNIEFGQPVRSGLTIFEQLGGAYDRELDSNYTSLVVGVRWSMLPQRRGPGGLFARYVVLGALELHAGGGMEVARVVGADHAKHAVLGQFGLTYLPEQGNDYAWGAEVRASVARYRGGRVENTVGFWLVARLRF